MESSIKRKKRKWFTFEGVCLCVIGIIATIICSELPKAISQYWSNNSNDPTNGVVMLGSGTVMQFLKEKCPKTANNKDVHFFDGPSITALEVLINGKEEKKSQIQMIVMSSTEIVEDSLIKLGWESNKHKLFEIKLGDDELRVVIWPPKNNIAKIYEGDQIGLNELYSLLNNDSLKYNLYLTTEKSGTRTEFKKYLNEIGTFNWPSNYKSYNLSGDVFDDINNSETLSVILCSSYYQHNKFKGKGLPVVYNDKILKRGLFLYFIGTNNNLKELKTEGLYSLTDISIIPKIMTEMGFNSIFKMQEGCTERNKIIKLKPENLD